MALDTSSSRRFISKANVLDSMPRRGTFEFNGGMSAGAGRGVELGQQPEGVELAPALGDAAGVHADNVGAVQGHLPAGGGHAEDLPTMGTGRAPAHRGRRVGGR